MSGAHFDALDTARDLEAAGIERPHAEAIARAVGRTVHRLATKADIQRLEVVTKSDIQRLEVVTKSDIEQHEASTKADFGRFEAAQKAEFGRFEAAMKADLANLRADMYRALWIQGAGIVAIVTALELLP